jgi:tRNA threonylcarbamoyladenosine biosynthesis protein TsaE
MLNLKAEGLAELDNVAAKILEHYPENRVFAFYGSMGAGKTTLIKSLCKQLRVRDVVVSPTFALINEYRRGQDEPVYHFDFYRINSLTDAFDMGYEEYFYSGAYCFIEWPEKIEQLLPPGFVYISICADNGDNTRTINVR